MEKLFISGIIASKGDKNIDQGEKVFTYDDLENFLQSRAGGDLTVYLDTPGGSVDEGFKIYNRLKAEGVTTVAQRANSIGSIIFLAGKERLISPDAEMIIHNAWIDPDALQGEKLNYHTSKMLVDYFAETDSRILDVYTSIAGEDKEREIFAYMAVDKNLGADKAMELGFATGVTEKAAAPQALRNRVLTYSQNMFEILNKQDGPITTYADVIAVNSEGKILMLKRLASDDFEPNKWCLPGGKVMQGEKTAEGAARELEEETGIKVGELEALGEEVNEDESVSHYFGVSIDSEPTATPEHAEWDFFTPEEIKDLEVIKGQNERFAQYISSLQTKTEMKTEEEISGLKKLLNNFARAFKQAAKNMTVTTSEGVELYVSGEGEGLAGKTAYIAEEGLPTETPAPTGAHTLSDGTTITVGEGGQIVEAVAPADIEALKATYEEEKKAMEEEKQAMEKEKEELQAKVVNLTQENEKLTKSFAKIEKDFIDLKNQVLGDPDEKKTAKTPTAEELKKMTPLEKIRAKAMNKASN